MYELTIDKAALVLVWDCDPSKRFELTDSLRQAGFVTHSVEDEQQVLDALDGEGVDLVVLSERGSTSTAKLLFCEIARRWPVPAILVTNASDIQDTLDLLESGAADFLTRPVRPDELAVRIQHALRQTSFRRSIFRYGDLILNWRIQRVWKRNISIALTPTGLQLLHYFMLHVGEVVRKEELLKNVWGFEDVAGDLNLVDSAIKRLRVAVEDDPKNPEYIITIWGKGYRFG